VLAGAKASSRPVGALPAGSTVAVTGRRDGAASEIVLEGWIDAKMLGPAVDTFARRASADGVRLRALGDAKSRILAQLRKGTGVTVVQAGKGFSFVRRGGWVATKSLGAVSAQHRAAAGAPPGEVRAVPGAAATRQSVAAPVPAGEGAVSVPDGALIPGLKGAELRTSPDGRSLAQLRPGALLVPLARERGWVRVRVEGWVPDKDVAPADTAMRGGLSAADLRADPQGTRGSVVRWEVQVLGLQTADPLRKDLQDGEPYLLARGPGTEDALLYLAVPPSLLAEARQLAPLTVLLVTARVRIGRSDPTGVPVLDLQTISRK
jgi:hypothetical protein